MTHDDIEPLLHDYAAGRLDETRDRMVESHVADCPECARRLDELMPIQLGAIGPSIGDEHMRRLVRRALRRTAVDAAAVTVIAVVVGLLLSLFVVQPLLLGRFDRAAASARATYETPMLFVPGATVTRFTISSGIFDRRSTSTVELPLGSGSVVLGDVTSEVGLLRVRQEWNPTDGRSPVPVADVLHGLDDGTVATVEMGLPSPLTVEQVQQLADDPGRDVRLVWAGFDVLSSSFGVVGYPLCRTEATPPKELFGASSASAGGSIGSGAASVTRAVESVRDALVAIAANDEVAAALTGGSGDAMGDLAQAFEGTVHVTEVVVTGPTREVAAFMGDLGVGDGSVLAVGFYSWGSSVCGR